MIVFYGADDINDDTKKMWCDSGVGKCGAPNLVAAMEFAIGFATEVVSLR